MIITFGEILLRLSTPGQMRLGQSKSFDVNYGGSESNVAVSMANFGHQVAHVTRVPLNPLGEAVKTMLLSHKVKTDFVLEGGSRLGTYYLETGAGLRASNVVYDRAASAMAEIKPGMVDWKKVFEKATWFHWSGITAAISQSAADVCKEALEAAEKAGVSISVDLNFRGKLWQYGKTPAQIMPELLQHCDVIFGGIDAPEKMFGIVPEDKESTRGELLETDLISISQQVLKKFPKAKVFSTTLRWIKNTQHHQLQGMIYDKKNLFLASVYDMPSMADRVGGGDAFMGGLIHGLIKQRDNYQEIVEFATAASVLKHYIHGDVNLATLAEVEALSKGQGAAISR